MDIPEIEVIDKRTGQPADMSVLEDTDTAFDPSRMHLDLTKAEKRRTTALLMAIQAYQNLIIKDADYLREVHNQARNGDGPKIQPATMDAMVEAAWKFDLFISGEMAEHADKTLGGSQTEVGAEVPGEGSGEPQ